MAAPRRLQGKVESPFLLENTDAYQRWRDRKLAGQQIHALLLQRAS